jgi:hypothetical protein
MFFFELFDKRPSSGIADRKKPILGEETAAFKVCF